MVVDGKIVYLFRKFLMSNRAKQRFEANMVNGRCGHEYSDDKGKFRWTDYDKVLRRNYHGPITPASLIGADCGFITFTWSDTDEGQDYWWDLHLKWWLFIKKYEEENRLH